MSGFLDPKAMWDYYPTRYLKEEQGDAARKRRRAQLEQGYLLSTPQPEIATMLADDYENEDRAKARRYQTMKTEVLPSGGYLDDLMRVLGDRASFGGADHVEGLANSLIYGTTADDALTISGARTEKALENLGPIAGPAANIAGTLGGYASMLPRLPAWLAGRLFAPAAVPAEMTRGYLDTQGDPGARLKGAYRQFANAPEMVFNPMTGRGLAANMFYQPAMAGAGLEELTASAYLNRLMDSGGLE
jgi:hypothetical protein